MLRRIPGPLNRILTAAIPCALLWIGAVALADAGAPPVAPAEAAATGPNGFSFEKLVVPRDAIRAGVATAWPVPADPGDLSAETNNLLNFELVGVHGPWTFQAEYLHSFLPDASRIPGGPDVGTVNYHGGYVQVLYYLTGESDYDHYNHKTAVFERIMPRENVLAARDEGLTGIGAWQVGARYNCLDLNDEGLNGGINGGPGDVEGASTSSSGSLGYDAGADGLKSIVLTGPSTLGGESVSSTWDSDTNTLTISSSRGDLMTVVLTDLASGAYTVNLLKPLMHTVSGTEDNITLNVGYTITDGDGDTADGSLTVTINDDTPTLQVGELDLNSSVTFIGTDAGYSNSYGYYIKGENGTPLGGKVIWANVHDQSSGDTFDLGDLDPASTGFFIIPDPIPG